MKKTLLGLLLITSVQLSADDNASLRQGVKSQKFLSHLDLSKLERCPKYININKHRMMDEFDKVVGVKNENTTSTSTTSTVEVKTFKEGSEVTIDACVGADNAIELKIENTFYWIEKQ
jgi:hypothetical protein